MNPQSTLQVDTLLDSNAAAFQVCSNQPGDCSLRGAISKANLLPGQEYLIELPAGVYNLTFPGAEENNNTTGDLDIYGRVTLTGAAAATTEIDGDALDRVIEIHNTAAVILRDLTITDGLSPPEANGGGVYNQGNLTIADSAITQNTTGAGGSSDGFESGGDGGSGGGIYNGGTLQIQNSQIIYNTAGSGGDGLYCEWNHPEKDCDSGEGGDGGAIFNTGSLVISQSNISGNSTGDGGSGGSVPLNVFDGDGGNGGDGGDGGGIYSTKTLKIYGSNISENQTGIGGSGGDGWYFNDGYAGYSGSGGGLYSMGTLIIEDTAIGANRTSEGAAGRNFYTRRGTGGHGGGIYTESGTIRMLRSQVKLNFTGPGGPGRWVGTLGMTSGGLGGAGGGIYNNQGFWVLDDVAVEGNKTGIGGTGAQGGNGGGIFNAGTLTVNSSVIQANQTGEGGEEEPEDDFGNFLYAGSGGLGGGIYNNGDLLIIYSRVESNQTGDGGSAALHCAPGGAGGGIFNQGTAQLTYSQVNANITGNSTQSIDPEADHADGGSGAGIYSSGEISLEYSSVLSNTTGDGGPGMNSGSGGGLYSDGSLFLNGVSLRENLVGQNFSGGFGGGAYIAGDTSTAIHNTQIADNRMVTSGLGSGIFADTVHINFVHTTLARNTGGDGSGLHTLDAILRLTNTILVSHTIGINASAGSIIRLDTTMWGSGLWANLTDTGGTGSIIHINDLVGTPGFVNPDLGDYHLGVGSDALDQGIHSITTTDIDNQPRPNPDMELPDLGADEYWSPTSISAVDITAPISGTTFASIPFTATVTPFTATHNIYYFWIPSPTTGQGTSKVTYNWRDAGQKTIQVNALNAYSSEQATWDIPIIATEYKVLLPCIYSSH